MKTKSEKFIFGNEQLWQNPDPGVQRQILGYDGQVMLVHLKFETGAIGTPHTHYHTQTTYIVSGKFEFTVGDETKLVSAGDGVYMEPDVVHGCRCIEAGEIIDVFSPMREGFLKA